MASHVSVKMRRFFLALTLLRFLCARASLRRTCSLRAVLRSVARGAISPVSPVRSGFHRDRSYFKPSFRSVC